MIVVRYNKMMLPTTLDNYAAQRNPNTTEWATIINRITTTITEHQQLLGSKLQLTRSSRMGGEEGI